MTKEEKQLAFANWWYELPQKEIRSKKQEIIERCFISRFIFIYWLSGRTEIPTICLSVIEEIAKKRIFKKECMNAKN